ALRTAETQIAARRLATDEAAPTAPAMQLEPPTPRVDPLAEASQTTAKIARKPKFPIGLVAGAIAVIALAALASVVVSQNRGDDPTALKRPAPAQRQPPQQQRVLSPADVDAPQMPTGSPSDFAPAAK